MNKRDISTEIIESIKEFELYREGKIALRTWHFQKNQKYKIRLQSHLKLLQKQDGK